MDIPILTFQEIIRPNDNDWDRAYSVLIYHLAKWNIVKEVTASGQVIYHNHIRVQSHNLIHERIFPSKHIVTKIVMRPRRKHINPNGNDGGAR